MQAVRKISAVALRDCALNNNWPSIQRSRNSNDNVMNFMCVWLILVYEWFVTFKTSPLQLLFVLLYPVGHGPHVAPVPGAGTSVQLTPGKQSRSRHPS